MKARLHGLALAVALFGVLAAVPVHADTVTFNYVSNFGSAGETTSGSGSFTFNGPLTTVSLSDLTAFSFSMTVNNPGPPPVSSMFNFGLADLLSFSATISSGSVSALNLQTGFVDGTNPLFFAEDFVVTGLGTSQAETVALKLSGNVVSTRGTVTTQGPGATTVPEPATIILLSSGLAAFVIRRKAIRNRDLLPAH